MVVLAAIGRFFKKIWDWIKQTAWIQPLLIVGIIFGVIFSIRPIVDAIEAAKIQGNSAETYYYNDNHFFTLSGGEKSAADKLSYRIAEKMDDPTKTVNYGTGTDKFFVAFVNKKGSSDAMKDGFQYLEKKMNVDPYFKADDSKPFKLVTIFVDEVTSETDTDKKESAFYKYLGRHFDLWADIGSRAEKTGYYLNNKLDDNRLQELSLGEESAFSNPVVMLVESTITPELASKEYKPGVTEIMFDVEGTGADGKAKTLLDCWNHKGDFSREVK